MVFPPMVISFIIYRTHTFTTKPEYFYSPSDFNQLEASLMAFGEKIGLCHLSNQIMSNPLGPESLPLFLDIVTQLLDITHTPYPSWTVTKVRN